MTDDELRQAWRSARDLKYYFKETDGAKRSDLEWVDMKMAEYGDWNLYRDKNGNYWEDYMSIGD